MVSQERLIILISNMAVHGIKINWTELIPFERDLIQFYKHQIASPCVYQSKELRIK